MVSVMLCPCMLCVALLMDRFVLCVVCLTVTMFGCVCYFVVKCYGLVKCCWRCLPKDGCVVSVIPVSV